MGIVSPGTLSTAIASDSRTDPRRVFRRADLTIFKHVQAEVPGGSDSSDLYPYVIYRCVVGSTAYGLAHEASDVDRRGFYLPPADLEWLLAGVPEQLETDNEEAYWEIEKFIPYGQRTRSV